MKNTKGYAALILAAAIYGAYGLFPKLIAHHFGAFSQNWAREGVVILLLLPIFVMWPSSWRTLRLRHIPLLILGGILTSASMTLLYYAFILLPVGTTYFLLYVTLTLGSFIGGGIFFKERITTVKTVAIVLIFLGLWLIYAYDLRQVSQYLYMFLPLLAGVISSGWYVISKKLGTSYAPLQMIFMYSLITVPLTLTAGFLVHEPIPLFTADIAWVWIVLYALVIIASTFFVLYGFKTIELQIASIILPMEVVFGTLFGWFLFSQQLPLTTLFGGLLIGFAAAFPSVWSVAYAWQKHK